MSASDDKKIFFFDEEKKSFELLAIKKKLSFKWNKLVFEDDYELLLELLLEREQIFDL